MKNFVVLLVLICIALPSWAGKEVGEAFPQLALSTEKGKSKLSDEIFSQNKLTLVEVWATQCGLCRKSFPFLNQLNARFEKQGLHIAAINTDMELDEVHDFLAKNNASFNIYYSDVPEVYEKLGLNGVPFVALIDDKGKFVSIYKTMRDKQKEQVLADIKSYLAPKPKPKSTLTKKDISQKLSLIN